MPREMTRRQVTQDLAAMAPAALATTTMAARSRTEARTGATAVQNGAIGPYVADVLPDGVRSRFVHNINGLRIHVLEAGFESGHRHRCHAAPRLPGASLQLTEHHGAAGGSRVSRVRARPAGLRPIGRALKPYRIGTCIRCRGLESTPTTESDVTRRAGEAAAGSG